MAEIMVDMPAFFSAGLQERADALREQRSKNDAIGVQKGNLRLSAEKAEFDRKKALKDQVDENLKMLYEASDFALKNSANMAEAQKRASQIGNQMFELLNNAVAAGIYGPAEARSVANAYRTAMSVVPDASQAGTAKGVSDAAQAQEAARQMGLDPLGGEAKVKAGFNTFSPPFVDDQGNTWQQDARGQWRQVSRSQIVKTTSMDPSGATTENVYRMPGGSPAGATAAPASPGSIPMPPTPDAIRNLLAQQTGGVAEAGQPGQLLATTNKANPAAVPESALGTAISGLNTKALTNTLRRLIPMVSMGDDITGLAKGAAAEWAAQNLKGRYPLAGEDKTRALNEWNSQRGQYRLQAQAIIKGIPSDKDMEMFERTLPELTDTDDLKARKLQALDSMTENALIWQIANYANSKTPLPKSMVNAAIALGIDVEGVKKMVAENPGLALEAPAAYMSAAESLAPSMAATIPKAAIDDLLADPSPAAKKEFDEVFGSGAADKVLGGK